ncbi:ABC transporter permease [Vallitalea longa]|uniref:ABC transporter permease n=2 Tax=Vallitalea longa TaxID=2936439 RepID=A0A9W6DDX1_9FIRM|nr:ABC transporter permease [Vallitalea longa]GKX28830.1 ABC transporter permease [Vallitalea longa]
MLKESIIMSWQNIIHNKMRSFLTILGIIIGVASIITLITIVNGVTDNVTSTVSDMGANKINVRISGTPLKQGLSDKDVRAIGDIDNIEGVAPTISVKTDIVYNKEVLEDITIQGKNQVYFDETDDLLESGRPINILDVDSKNRICLIGQNVVYELFKTESPIGKDIIINGVRYSVVGTLKESDNYSMNSNDDSIIIPYTTAMSLMGVKNINSVDIFVNDGDLSQTTTSDTENYLKTLFNNHEDAFVVTNMQNILDTVSEMTGMMSLMLVGIASISLIVGGIGIMNMMLVSVTERTTEIGIRKALGADPRRIQQQFLIESIFLSLVGGIIGLLTGIAIAFLGCLAIGVTFSLSVSTLLLAVGFSVGVGVIFGFTPAKNASRLNPIDALRSV